MKHHSMHRNGLDLPQLPEVSAIVTSKIRETLILLKRIYSLKDEKKVKK